MKRITLNPTPDSMVVDDIYVCLTSIIGYRRASGACMLLACLSRFQRGRDKRSERNNNNTYGFVKPGDTRNEPCHITSSREETVARALRNNCEVYLFDSWEEFLGMPVKTTEPLRFDREADAREYY